MRSSQQRAQPSALANVVVSQVLPAMLYVYVLLLADPQYRMRSPLFSMTNFAFAEGVTVQAGTV